MVDAAPVNDMPPTSLVMPTEEHRHNHSAAELVSGRRRLIPTGLPVVIEDRLFLDWAAFPIEVTRNNFWIQ